jgi:hypothetical protein
MMRAPEAIAISAPQPPAARVAIGAPAALRALRRWSWQGVGLVGAILVAVVLNLLHLDQLGYANAYYAATVRSLLTSWRNFFFAYFDPGGFVTVDMPPVGFWRPPVVHEI